MQFSGFGLVFGLLVLLMSGRSMFGVWHGIKTWYRECLDCKIILLSMKRLGLNDILLESMPYIATTMYKLHTLAMTANQSAVTIKLQFSRLFSAWADKNPRWLHFPPSGHQSIHLTWNNFDELRHRRRWVVAFELLHWVKIVPVIDNFLGELLLVVALVAG